MTDKEVKDQEAVNRNIADLTLKKKISEDENGGRWIKIQEK